MSARMLVLAVGAWMSLCVPAHAAITAFWQRATITPQAIANDPQLASMQCWDLMATTTGNWNSAQMRADLPGGRTFYKHPLGGLTKPDPSIFNSSPALEFTTYASSPSDNGTNNSTIILSGHPQGNPPSLGDPSSPIPGSFGLAWGNLLTDPPGTHQIARLTFPIGAVPDVLNVGTFDPSKTSQIDPDSTTIIPDIPEPKISALLALLGLFAIRIRMRCY